MPHFEKMLYDNAQLLRVYVHWVRLQRRLVLPAGEAASVASRVADWMLHSLVVGDPAIPVGSASSLDADTVVDEVHHEGASYLGLQRASRQCSARETARPWPG